MTEVRAYQLSRAIELLCQECYAGAMVPVLSGRSALPLFLCDGCGRLQVWRDGAWRRRTVGE
jgi:hypothetical protein